MRSNLSFFLQNIRNILLLLQQQKLHQQHTHIIAKHFFRVRKHMEMKRLLPVNDCCRGWMCSFAENHKVFELFQLLHNIYDIDVEKKCTRRCYLRPQITSMRTSYVALQQNNSNFVCQFYQSVETWPNRTTFSTNDTVIVAKYLLVAFWSNVCLMARKKEIVCYDEMNSHEHLHWIKTSVESKRVAQTIRKRLMNVFCVCVVWWFDFFFAW